MSDGQDTLDGEAVTIPVIASEITAKYRSLDQYLQDRAGVSYDGPLCLDIEQAMEASYRNGYQAGYREAKGGGKVQ